MFQNLVAPATAVNMVVFRAFGLFPGCVSLRGEFEVRLTLDLTVLNLFWELPARTVLPTEL